MRLGRYNPDAICPKCGHDEVGTFHHDSSSPMDKFWPDLEDREYLSRTCRRCHYEWAECPTPKRKKEEPIA